jgi:tryptophan 2,3-dioxygenase
VTTYSSYLKLDELLALQQEPRAHDELLFVVLHQSHELWFKLILHELDESVRLIETEGYPEAETRLRRIVTIMRQLIAQWDVLGTMTPAGYLEFRHVLEGGSGIQSAQFRQIEEASAERLGGAFDAALRRGGVTDVAELLRGGPSLLTMLAETLLDYDEAFGHWRHRHVLAVERQIGLKPGTGGSTGAAYLRGTLTKRFFPALWEARTRL